MELEADQIRLFALMLIDGVERVPDEIVRTWKVTADAMKWGFENRKGQAGKPVDFFAKHLKRRRQTIYKMIEGVNKLDPTESDTWDMLTGWSAVDQFVKMQKEMFREAQAQAIQEIIKSGLYPVRRVA